MNDIKERLMKALSEYNLIKDDEDAQILLDFDKCAGKPSIFTHWMDDILRKLNISDNLKTTKDLPLARRGDTLAEHDQKVKLRKNYRRSVKSVTTSIKSNTSGTSRISKKITPRKPKSIPRDSQLPSSETSRKSKLKSSSEGSEVSLDVGHIANVTIKKELQQELKCESGVDIFMEMPWKIISKRTVLNTLQRDQKQSPFYDYATNLQTYPEEEILIGRANLNDTEAFLVAITVHGRNILLEEIKSAHLDKWNKILKRSNFPIGKWKTLGSEKEMEMEVIQSTRPPLSYDCYIKKKYHEMVYKEGFSSISYYTELKEENLGRTENIQGVAFHKHVQVSAEHNDSFAQTIPEIPVNSTTQFTIEMRVMENEEKLKDLSLDWEMLNNKLNEFFYKIDTFLTYNEEYDLYKDDYEVIASEGKEINMFPNIPYEHYLTMLTFVGTKGKGITSTSWHPSQTGIVAVSYGKKHVAKVGDLNNFADDESTISDSDEEDLIDVFQISNKFDEHIKNIWEGQLEQLENDMKEQTCNNEDYDLAVESSQFLEQTKNLRLFQIIQEKKRFLKTPDAEDMYQQENFEYPLFEGTKKKQKKKMKEIESFDKIIDRVMSKEPSFLKRDYLFSGNFHWKLKIADDLVNPMDLLLMKTQGSVPKKYLRTFLFREIWGGDSWNFGDDLKYAAIEANKDFRESGILALGFPHVPESKIFLPGYKNGDEIDYALELNPWQWIDVWLEHCVYCAKNNIPMPRTIDETKHDFTEKEDNDDIPFSFLFNTNVPLCDVEYEDINFQYFLCNSKKCHQCQFLIDNFMSKEGKDHICFKLIMNKENPNEVDRAIIVPYEEVHGVGKKEEKFILKKKQKTNIDVDKNGELEGENESGDTTKEIIEDENVNENLMDDEYEFPYCSLENGCLLRKLLPEYLRDSRTEKLFCDQCHISKTSSSNENLCEKTIHQNKPEKNIDSESKYTGGNKDSEATESESSEAPSEEEVEDAVGNFFQITQIKVDEREVSEKTNINRGLILPGEGGHNENYSELVQDKKKSHKSKMVYDTKSIELEKEEENSEELSEYSVRKSKSNKLGKDDFFGHKLSGNIIFAPSGFIEDESDSSGTCSKSSSSVTFKSSIANNKSESLDYRETERLATSVTCPKYLNAKENPKIQQTNKSITQRKEFTEKCEKNHDCEEVILDIKHILEDPVDDSRDFSDETKKIINEELEKLECGLRTKVIKRQFEELSSCESSHGLIESSDDEEDLDKLNLVHHVAIWSIANDIKPMRRLTSPFEITALSFCPHNGRFLAGGTSTGQVVLWDLEDPLEHIEHQMHERSDFDLLGFKHLERVRSWFKRLRPDQRIHITAISNKKSSHLDRIVDVTWLPPNIKISPSKGNYEELNQQDDYSLQFMSTSGDGVLKFWDVTSSPLPSSEPPSNKNAFQCPGQFKLPSSFEKHKSKYFELFLRWDPIFQVRFEQRDNLAVKKYHVTSVSHDQVVYNYEKLIDNMKKVGRNIELQGLFKVANVCTDSMNSEALIGTVDGCIILFSWKPQAGGQEIMYDEKSAEQEGIAAKLIQQFKPIHDGPITNIERHPENNNIFLSSGGHIFALWKINNEGPLKWRKDLNCFITTVGWSQCQPSSFRVGRSDGSMEIWDLDEIGNEPKMVLQVTSGPIYEFTVPRLPCPRGLFGIADHRGILKFYNIPWEYQISRPNEAERFFEKIEVEHNRKIAMEKKSVENVYQVKKEISEPLDSETNIGQKESEENIRKKEIIGCKKFKEELYKWYLRRRGKNSVWLDESEKKWYNKEEEYMIKTILKNKNINIKELDDAIAPLYRKEKHDKKVAVKILDVLEMADEIFKNAVQNLALVKDHSNKSQISLEIETMCFGDLSEVTEKLDRFFGVSYEKNEEELEAFVKHHKIDKEWTFAELCKKNQHMRDFWNDRRRLFNPEYKLSRELVKEEVEKAGHQLSYYINHEESYLRKKYKRRLENIDKLKKKFGDDYDPYWDQHDRYGNRNIKAGKLSEHKSENIMRYEEISSHHAKNLASKRPERDVNIILPEGSFYRKYMPADKNLKWEKPISYEERTYRRSKMYKDKLGESDVSMTPEPSAVSAESEFGSVEPIYEEDEENRKSSLKNKINPEIKEDSPEKSTSSSSTTEDDEAEDDDKPNDKTKVAVSFKDSTFPKSSEETGKGEVPKTSKKVIDFEKEDITDICHGLDDLRRIVKEKKLRGEEIIDLDDLSVSYESISGTISSSAPSPDMSLKSEDLCPDEWRLDEDSEEELFQQYFEEGSLRHDTPKTVPYDSNLYTEEPTEEWMEEDLIPAIKTHEKEEQENEEEETEESVKKPAIETSTNLEKEKEISDRIEALEAMDRSPDVITIVPPGQGEAKPERIKHLFDESYVQGIDFLKKTD